MKLKTLYVRFYKSFNYDYLRKNHPDSEPNAWDIVGDDSLFYPFIRVPIESGISTIVGANESGKSQILAAVKALLAGNTSKDHTIRPRDFCRYSQFFSVSAHMNLPEFGGEFSDLSSEEQRVIREVAGTGKSRRIESFWFFRMNDGPQLFLKSDSGSEPVALTGDQVASLSLPTFFEINAKTPLPDSVPLSYLTATPGDKKARSRQQVFAWTQMIVEHPDWFSSAAEVDQAKAQIAEGYTRAPALDAAAESDLMDSLALAEKLLVQVAGIGTEAFAELAEAVKSEDGYANAIVSKMNDQLDAVLNFPKWWKQDSEFSLALTLRDFDLVFTVRDRTGSEYAFSERSGGMSYFLSYFVQYLSHIPAGGQEILLMDEPDAYLSMQGQQDLLRIFEDFAHPEDPDRRPVQVIYVTHSPFLIDKNHSERIRVLEKGDGEEGTRLVKNAGRNHYEPLRSAFGAFVAETTFISNCNLMLEGQADQVLLAGISSLSRASGAKNSLLDLNTLTLVPAGSAEHLPYMVYLARGRDVDKPAIVVLLDGDAEGDRIAAELAKGYRDKKYVDDDLVIQTSDIKPTDVSIDTDCVREIEDLIPAEVAVAAIHRIADDVLSTADAATAKSAVSDLTVPAGSKLFKTAQDACTNLAVPLRLDKVAFARAVLEVLSERKEEPSSLRALANFAQLFRLLSTSQREAERRNSRERVSRTVGRHVKSFIQDHPHSCRRREVTALFDDIASQLTETTAETESLRATLRGLAAEFSLSDEPESRVNDLGTLKERLQALRYEGVHAVQG